MNSANKETEKNIYRWWKLNSYEGGYAWFFRYPLFTNGDIRFVFLQKILPACFDFQSGRQCFDRLHLRKHWITQCWAMHASNCRGFPSTSLYSFIADSCRLFLSQHSCWDDATNKKMQACFLCRFRFSHQLVMRLAVDANILILAQASLPADKGLTACTYTYFISVADLASRVVCTKLSFRTLRAHGAHWG